MQLGEIIALACSGATARVRRYALAYGACAVLAIVAMFQATAAAALVLEPHLGAVMARLAVALALAGGMTGIIVARRPRKSSPATATAHALPIATLLEVFLLGYSLAQRLSDRKSRRP
jgi:hypothetical protein